MCELQEIRYAALKLTSSFVLLLYFGEKEERQKVNWLGDGGGEEGDEDDAETLRQRQIKKANGIPFLSKFTSLSQHMLWRYYKL